MGQKRRSVAPAGPAADTFSRVARTASIVACAFIPLGVVAVMFPDFLRGRLGPTDYPQFHHAAQAILHGRDPYQVIATSWWGPYPYPPLPALAAAPLTLLSMQAAGLLVEAMLLAAVLGAIFAAGVRDWRCYGIALLWPPVISGIETGTPTLWLALAAALAWRYRERVVGSAAAIGLALAVKLFLWPLVVWLAATRRIRAAALSLLVGAGVLVLSWAVIGFSGLLEYPELLRRLDRAVSGETYTTYAAGLDLGLPGPVARATWTAVGIALIAAVGLLARRNDDRSAFILAIAASLALMPILWLHYFALLLVVVAIAQPTLGVLWFLPLGMALMPTRGPTSLERSQALIIATLAIGLSLLYAVRAARPANRNLERLDPDRMIAPQLADAEKARASECTVLAGPASLYTRAGGGAGNTRSLGSGTLEW